MQERSLIKEDHHHEKETLPSISTCISRHLSCFGNRGTHLGRTRNGFYCDHPSLIGRYTRANEQEIVIYVIFCGNDVDNSKMT